MKYQKYDTYNLNIEGEDLQVYLGIDPKDIEILKLMPNILDALNSAYCECNVLYPCKKNCFMLKIDLVIKKIKGL